MYYRKANAAMLVFDITNPESFEDLKGWVLGRCKLNSLFIFIFGITFLCVTYIPECTI